MFGTRKISHTQIFMSTVNNHPKFAVYPPVPTNNSACLYPIIHSVVVDNLSCGHLVIEIGGARPDKFLCVRYFSSPA